MSKDEKKIIIGLVLLLILAGVGGYAVQKKEQKQTQALKDQLVFSDLNPANVNQVILCPKDHACVTLLRRPKDEHQFDYIDQHAYRDAEWMVDHGWVVETSSDQTLLTSPGSIDTFFESLANVKIDKKDALTDKNKSQYQLDQPILSLTITNKDTDRDQLTLGTINPSDTHRYALKNDQQQWWLIEKNLDAYLQTKWQDWVEKNWLRVNQDKMQSMTIRSSGQVLALKKTDEKWIFDDQDKSMVDIDQLTKWFRHLNTSQATQWIYASENDLEWRAKYGFDQPLVKVDMEYGKDSERPSVGWQLSKDSQKEDQYYVKRDDQPWIHALKPGDAKALMIQKVDWIDRTLLSEPLQDYQSVTWRGEISGKAVQKDGQWSLANPEPDALSMDHLKSMYEALVHQQDKRIVSVNVPMPKDKGVTLTWTGDKNGQTLHLFEKNNTHFIWRKYPSQLLLASDQNLKKLITGHVSSLRQQKLFSGSPENLTTIAYKSDQGQWSIALSDTDQQWQWDKSVEGRSSQEAFEAFDLITEIKLENISSLQEMPSAMTSRLTLTSKDGQSVIWQWQPTDAKEWVFFNASRKVQGTVKAEKAQTWAKFLIKESL